MRDEAYNQFVSASKGYEGNVAKATQEIQQRHDALNQLMSTAKDVGARTQALAGKIEGVSDSLQTELDARQGLRDAIHSLGRFLTTLD